MEDRGYNLRHRPLSIAVSDQSSFPISTTVPTADSLATIAQTGTGAPPAPTTVIYGYLYTVTKIRYKLPYLPELIDIAAFERTGRPARLLDKSTSQVMKPTTPENFDGDTASDRLDPT